MQQVLDQVDASLEQELDKLHNSLQSSRDQVLLKWTGEEYKSLTQDCEQRHQDTIQKSSEKIQLLKTKINKIQHQSSTFAKALEEEYTNLEALKKELQTITDQTDSALQSRESMETELGEISNKIVKEKELIQSQSNETQEKLKNLEKAAGMFAERLCFRFKKTSGGRLQFIFTCLDREDPEAVYYFFLKIDSDRKYLISECDPPVSDIDDLVKKLNETNNLKSFVVAVRKRFKDMTINKRS